jgi:putative addiction module component (TIGR02574 family)
MTPKALMDEILRLPINERLQLVEDVWDSIAATPEAVPIPEWHKAELDRRLANPDPGPSLSWEEVRARLRQPKKP